MDDLYETRRKRLLALKQRFNTQAALADAIGCSANYISRLLKDPPDKHIGEAFARRVEEQIGLDRGWLDAGDVDAIDDAQHHRDLTAEAIDLARQWQRLCAPFRAQIVSLVATLAQHERGKSKPKRTKREAA